MKPQTFRLAVMRSNLEPHLQHMALTLASMCSAEGYVTATVAQISAATGGKSRPTVYRALAALRDRGWLLSMPRAGHDGRQLATGRRLAIPHAIPVLTPGGEGLTDETPPVAPETPPAPPLTSANVGGEGLTDETPSTRKYVVSTRGADEPHAPPDPAAVRELQAVLRGVGRSLRMPP